VGKIVFWGIVVILVLTAMRMLASQAAARKQRPRERSQSSAGTAGSERHSHSSGDQTTPARAVEQMVRCAHCGIHLPRSDALLIDGHTWCSQGHALLSVRH
jgi:uncharacterized protein